VEDEETLETRTVISQTPDLIHHWVDLFFSYGIMTASGVAGSVFLASDHGLRMEKTAIGTASDLIDDVGFKVNVEGTGDVFSCRSF
jgi:hypothetical protein